MSVYPSQIAVIAATSGNNVQDTARRARIEALHNALVFQLFIFGNWNKAKEKQHRGGAHDATMRALATHRIAWNAALAWNGPN